MAGLLRLAAAIDRLNRRIGRVMGWATLAMVLLGAFNAVARYTDRYVQLGLSSNAWIELQWYLFSLVFLLGAPWALRANAHVRVDVLYGRLSERARVWIDLVGGVVFLLPFCIFAVIASWPGVRDSFAVLEQSPDPDGLPRYPIKAVVLVAFFLIALQGLSEIVKRIAWLRGAGAEEIGLVEPRESRTADGDEPSSPVEGI